MIAGANAEQTTTTTHTDSMSNPKDTEQPKLAVASAPSFCRLCDTEIPAEQTWRAHVKSDAHVQKLKSKVAEPAPGSAPSSPPLKAKRRNRTTKLNQPSLTMEDDDVDQLPSEPESTSDDNEVPVSADFDPSRCLFCTKESEELDDTLKHMSTAHSFNIPFQDFLAVELETVVAYLQFIIYGYQECICCNTQRSTVEGIQQHMTAKGHCRFEITQETEEFYEMTQSENAIHEQAGTDSVRLPSGKIVTQRKTNEPQEPKIRKQQQETIDHDANAGPSEPSTEIARRGDGRNHELIRSNEALFAAQMSRLRIADGRAQQKAEVRKRGRLEQANNTLLQKHFKVSAGDGRFAKHL